MKKAFLAFCLLLLLVSCLLCLEFVELPEAVAAAPTETTTSLSAKSNEVLVFFSFATQTSPSLNNIDSNKDTDHFIQTIEIIFSIAILVLALVFMLLSLILFGKGARADYEGDYFKELPSDFNPRKLGLFMNNKNSTQDMLATLLNLAQRGYIRIEEYLINDKLGLREKNNISYRFFRNEKKGGLDAAEESLLNYIFSIGKTEVISEFTISSVSIEDIENKIKDNRREFASFWNNWLKNIAKTELIEEFIDEKYLRLRTIIWFSYSAFIFLGLVYAIFDQKYIFLSSIILLSVISYFIMLYSSLFIQAHNQAGADLYAKWQAFVYYMNDFANHEVFEIQKLVIWENYLPYAAQFKASDKVLKQLNSIYPNLKDGDYVLAAHWFISIHDKKERYLSLSHMINSIGDSMQNCVDKAIKL